MKIDNVLILAGGRGTRSQNPSIPKVLQKLTEETDLASILEKQLEEFNDTKIIWLLSHLENQVRHRLQGFKGNHEIHTDPGTGTRDAVISVSSELAGNNSLLILGDCLMGGPLRQMTQQIQSDRETHFFVRVTDHPQDSDLIIADSGNFAKEFIPKGESIIDTNGIPFGLSGLTITPNEVLRNLVEEKDVQKAIFVTSRIRGIAVKIKKNSWYIRDTGTPQRLAKARQDFLEGVVSRQSKPRRSAIFIDRDGTLVPNLGEARTSISVEDVPSAVRKAVNRCNKMGVPVIVVTNQPGLAKGFIEHKDLENTISQLHQALMPGRVDDFYFCPHHPEVGWAGEIPSLKKVCECRKPKAGLFHVAANEHLLDLEASYMIGDTSVDEVAAQAAKCKFIQASYSAEGVEVSHALERALEEILSAGF